MSSEVKRPPDFAASTLAAAREICVEKSAFVEMARARIECIDRELRRDQRGVEARPLELRDHALPSDDVTRERRKIAVEENDERLGLRGGKMRRQDEQAARVVVGRVLVELPAARRDMEAAAIVGLEERLARAGDERVIPQRIRRDSEVHDLARVAVVACAVIAADRLGAACAPLLGIGRVCLRLREMCDEKDRGKGRSSSVPKSPIVRLLPPRRRQVSSL